MSLFPNSVRSIIPATASESEIPLADSLVYVRFYDQNSAWQWYVMEFDQDDTFLGIVSSGVLALLGNFKLSELEGIEDIESGEKSVKRDTEFAPTPISALAETNSFIRDLLQDIEEKIHSQPSDLVVLD